MAVPGSLAVLSTTPSSNPPAGTDSVFPELDDHLRFIYSCMAMLTASQHQRLSAVGGTADAITGSTASGAPTAYADGQVFWFKATGANTSTTPTLNVNGLGAKTIVRFDGSALVAGDIAASGQVVLVIYNGTNFAWINPLRVPRSDSATSASTSTTAAAGNSSTSIATTAFVQANKGGRSRFTASGSFVVPAGVTTVYASGCAAGGGGGASSSGTSATGSGGGGGGAGQPALSVPMTVVPGETLTITIPSTAAAGGTSSQQAGANGGNLTIVGSTSGSLLSLTGGNGGGAGANSGGGSSGGAKGSGYPAGSDGQDATATVTGGAPAASGGVGASGPYGGGGGAGRGGSGEGLQGSAAHGFGAGGGGGGGYYIPGAGKFAAGGSGAPGFLLLEW